MLSKFMQMTLKQSTAVSKTGMKLFATRQYKVSKDEKLAKLVGQYDHNVINEIKIDGDDTIALCRCWQSKKFPHCDGSHGLVNGVTGDNLGPILVSRGGASA